MDKRKLRLEELAKLADDNDSMHISDDTEMFDELRQKKDARKAKLDDEMESGEYERDYQETREKASDETWGKLTDEQKEELAEKIYHKRRKELGLE
jgi:hypothetical protein